MPFIAGSALASRRPDSLLHKHMLWNVVVTCAAFVPQPLLTLRTAPAVVAGMPTMKDLPRSTQLNRQAFNRRNMNIDERRAYDELMEERSKTRSVQLVVVIIALAAICGTALFGPR